MRWRIVLAALLCVPDSSSPQAPNLWGAIFSGDATAVERYLASGGDPNAAVYASYDETTNQPIGEPVPILRLALSDREQTIALMLLRGGADFESLARPLSSAASEGLDQVLAYLIAQDPRRLAREVATEGGRGLLISPATRGYADVLELLLTEAERHEIAWSPDVLTEALAASVSFRQNDAARLLLDHGAVATGMVLRVAARDGSPGILRTVLDLGVDPNARLPESDVDPELNARTALEYAWRRYGRDPLRSAPARLIMRELINAGARNEDALTGEPLVPADALQVTAGGAEPAERLLYAARFGFLDDVAGLLRSPGFDARIRGEAAKVALLEQQNDVARMLIESEVPLNDGILHAAARGNSPGIVRWLIALGADPALASGGLTPVEHWLERQERGYIGIGGHYVLHELLIAGSPACWLWDHESSLDVVTHMFLRSDAPQCEMERN